MTDLLVLTAEIVASYLARNTVPMGEIAGIVQATHGALAQAAAGPPAETAMPTASPAAVRRSVTPEALISFEDGKSYRTLRRHLARYGLTPESYRQKWGLPANYPIVAPAYSERRSALAKASGLGSRTGGHRPADDQPPAQSEGADAAPKPRGRPRKSSR